MGFGGIIGRVLCQASSLKKNESIQFYHLDLTIYNVIILQPEEADKLTKLYLSLVFPQRAWRDKGHDRSGLLR